MIKNFKAVGVSLLLLLFALALLALPAAQEKTYAAKMPPSPWKRISSITPPSCGDGLSGDRVQLVYLRNFYEENNYSQVLPIFGKYPRVINTYILEASVRNGGVPKKINFVTNKYCHPKILEVAIYPGKYDMSSIIEADPKHGVNRSYMVWDGRAEENYCGHGGPPHPGHPGFAWIGRQCQSPETALHEFFHTLGAVRPEAPMSTPWMHCTDGKDIMCYNDNSPSSTSYTDDKCPETVVDCGNDTYFDARRVIPPTSWLFLNPQHNVANSKYLTSR